MKRKEYLTRRDKIVDFIIGFVGIFVFNVAVYLLVYYVIFIPLYIVVGFMPGGARGIVEQVINIVVAILPWVINAGSLIFCVSWRPWIAIGAFSALGALFVTVFVLALLLKILIAVGCLTIIGMTVLMEIMGM